MRGRIIDNDWEAADAALDRLEAQDTNDEYADFATGMRELVDTRELLHRQAPGDAAASLFTDTQARRTDGPATLGNLAPGVDMVGGTALALKVEGFGGGGRADAPATPPPTAAPSDAAPRRQADGVFIQLPELRTDSATPREPANAPQRMGIRTQFPEGEAAPAEVGDALFTNRAHPGSPLAGLSDELRGDLGERFKTPALLPALHTDFNREAYDRLVDNAFLRPGESPMSTFSVDVDTASYANVRRFLTNGQLPPPDAVRIEELINYFQYDYPQPESPEIPFAADIKVTSAPWNPKHRLVRIGLQAADVKAEDRPGANLVFLIDVSGSMQDVDKLPLVQRGMRTLVDQLDERDSVAIVVYAGNSGVVLPATNGANADTIRAAIDRLQSGGSTNGAAGIEQAYQVARENFREGGVNRVILATDGDFNVGITDRGQLTRLIENEAETGVFLTLLGFGTGNLQDATMEELSNKGDGFYAYIDSDREADRVLGERMISAVQAVAKDVKIQVEFNPQQVGAYRLIGYANRLLEDRDFNDDTKDAGDTGAGHQVTAFYEIIPPAVMTENVDEETARLREVIKHLQAAQASAGQGEDGTTPFAAEIAAAEERLKALMSSQLAPPTDELRYLQPTTVPAEVSDELMTVKLRWKSPDEKKVQGTSEKVEWPVTDAGAMFADADADVQFAASVAGFGMLLRGSPYAGDWEWATLAEQLEPLKKTFENARLDAEGMRRAEFIELVDRAATMSK